MNDQTIDHIHAAPIDQFLESRGFRRNRNRWACIAHDDRRPSCTISRNRLKCWVCNRTWSSIDLLMELDGLSLSEAVRYLAAFYGVPTRQVSPAERQRYAQTAARAIALAQRLADFARGLERVSERRLTAAYALGIDPEAVALWHSRAHLLKQVTPKEIAAGWRATSENARAAIEQIGREDREHAEKITWAVVDILARSQEAAA